MKNNKKENIFFTFCFLLLVCTHLTFELNLGDDIYFNQIDFSNIIEWLGIRYNTWSSRLFIEFILVLLLKLPHIIWCLLNSFMIILITYCISYLFTKNTFKDKILSFLLVCLYPLSKVSGTGWYATTLNYLWPLAIGLFALIPIKNALIEKKESKSMQILYSLALIFACNQEQMCALILGFYLVFIIYLYKEKKLNKYIIFQFLLSLSSIIFILTCPGNDVRFSNEITSWYPEYENFNLIKKATVGLLSTMSKVVISLETPLLLLLIIIPYLLRKDKSLIKLNSYIPIFLTVILKNFDKFLLKLKIYEQKIVIFDSSMIPIILMSIVFIISVTMSLYFIFKKTKSNLKYLIPLIFVAGLLSRLILSFSPTVYASGIRTYIFYDFSIIIVLFSIIRSFIKKENYDFILLLLAFLNILYK